ncbi:MAG TPA: hypothetical protein VM842_00860 [Nitrospira sp.]|jgi:hypothetical protein|nr:hypothetical protein [Nitrospira sp.]
MNLQISIAIVGIFAVSLSSACASLDNGSQQPKQKQTALQRVERFTTSLTRTLTDAANDVLPIVAATSNELVREVKSDLPKVTEELSREVSRTFSFLRPRGEAAP